MALCLGILAPVAPYEIVFIFPINDRIDELEKRWKNGSDVSTEEKGKLRDWLDMWKARNWGRVAAPLVHGVVGDCKEKDISGVERFSAKSIMRVHSRGVPQQ
ncbi:hypothetical protein K458DRAFT_404500 [Lentithecium fluviatile CBS 122367]|uniref:Uncharacterized protein n=1 Tax=Lentithecium fluviatile CBS 122367 TaxID=1168545 RepID=A0A6G1J132_9PLEO|nr:hypothetical protein K458DRAFT_404500 [Lentithecium fluviatile CBS 122367]